MRSVLWAFFVVILLISAVFLNSIVISYNIKEVIGRLERIPSSLADSEGYSEIRKDFTEMERYLSITVSHNDLADIDRDFAELEGAIEAEDEESLIITKSRLINALGHLKRLTDISIDSIF